MNVLIIAEDDRNDRFILQPIVNAMFRRLRRPSTRVATHVFRDGGWEAVKEWESIRQIIESNQPTDLFLLCVDRDGHEPRRKILNGLEEKASKVLSPSRLFLAEHAWQEVEVWALAGIDWRLKPKWTWEAIRNERDSKEHYFEPIVKDRGLSDTPGRGRSVLGPEAARNYAKVRQNCHEVRELEDRIRRWIDTAPHN
jgi:hypothetical protein